MKATLLVLLIVTLSFLPAPLIRAATYDVMALGAKPDGLTDSSQAFLAAWDAVCESLGRQTIYVPSGRYLIGKPITFSGAGGGRYCKNNGVTIIIRGTIVAPANYLALGNANMWISFVNVNGVIITGGVFDGQGDRLWACKMSGKGGCPRGVSSLSFQNSMNVVVSRITSLNSQLFHIVINGCKNVKVQGVRITAPGTSPNTDGIHVQRSSGVTIQTSIIGTGDDCISIGPGTSNLWMENIKCGPGHGISIGSLGRNLDEAGVQNVTVNRATFVGTQYGVRIKTWARPSYSFVKDVVYQHITMVNARNPIIIDQNYCPSNVACPNQVSGVAVSGVKYKDIQGSSATAVAVNFDCSSSYHCTGIRLENVNLTYNNKKASSTCANAVGSASGVVQPQSCLY